MTAHTLPVSQSLARKALVEARQKRMLALQLALSRGVPADEVIEDTFAFWNAMRQLVELADAK